MSSGTIVSVVILLVGLAWLAWPLVRRNAGTGAADVTKQKEREALVTAYERILTTIRDLDEDQQIGKLPQDVYAIERAHWAAQGAAVLQALEKLGGYKPPKRAQVAPSAADTALDEAIETAISRYVKAHGGD
jgi:hypothetical protein